MAKKASSRQYHCCWVVRNMVHCTREACSSLIDICTQGIHSQPEPDSQPPTAHHHTAPRLARQLAAGLLSCLLTSSANPSRPCSTPRRSRKGTRKDSARPPAPGSARSWRPHHRSMPPSIHAIIDPSHHRSQHLKESSDN